MTPETLALRELIEAYREEFQAILDRYGATSPKLFGSVARGTARPGADIDMLVELDPADGNLLKRAISASVLVDAVALSRDPARRIADVLGAIERCQRDVAALGADAGMVEMAEDAIERNLQIIGEAVNPLPGGDPGCASGCPLA